MKKIGALFISSILTVSAVAHAQTVTTRLGNSESETFSCYYFGTTPETVTPCNVHTFRSNEHAEQVIDNILKHAGMGYGRRNFFAVECPSVDNCYATRISGVQYIVYDNKFLKQVEDWTHTDWGAISIMAHEIAHHLNGHTADRKGSRPENEKQADYFSGFVLHNLGATLTESQVAIRTLTTENPSPTHPPKSERLKAIEEGWRDAEGMYPQSKPFSPKQPSLTALNVEKSVGKGGNVDNSVEKRSLGNSGTLVESNPKAKVTGCIDGNCTNGEGTFMHISGEQYEGDWVNGKRHGWGTHYYANGQKRYEGQFVLGKREGKGIYFYENGDKYVGDFRDDHLNGKGTYYYANGDRYAGGFKNDRREGPGTYLYANGKKEVNFYKEDKREQPLDN